MRASNYIPGKNPFNLAGPPKWWLDRLWDYDDSLVVMASHQGYFYRLAQRRRPDLRTDIVNDIMKEDTDTRELYRNGLIPITTILATARWDNPEIFRELSRRAPWRNGGAEAFEGKILDQERQEEIEKLVRRDEMLTDASKDGWKYYQKLIGTRSNLYSPKTTSNRPEIRTGIRRVGGQKPYRPEIVTSWGNPRSR